MLLNSYIVLGNFSCCCFFDSNSVMFLKVVSHSGMCKMPVLYLLNILMKINDMYLYVNEKILSSISEARDAIY